MTIKTVLVHAGADDGAAARIGVARSLASYFDAAVYGVGAMAWDPFIDPSLGYVDAHAVQALRDQYQDDMRAAEAAFLAAGANYAPGMIWRGTDDYPDRALAAYSRCADIVVAQAHEDGADPRRAANPQNLVMETGLPVLIAPADQDHLDLGMVLLAWKNTRETRRALTDAIPLMRAAAKVAIVQVMEKDAPAAEGELEDVAARLARHGVQADCEVLPQTGGSVTEDLLDIAHARSADLLVLGAYGRSRLREWAFGGVTRDLLAGARQPVLFSR